MSEYAKASKPTIWYRLGFRFSWDEELFNWRNTEVEGFAPSAMNTEVHVQASWLDRLRFLITGHAAINIYMRTDVLVNKCESRSQFAVLGPRKP